MRASVAFVGFAFQATAKENLRVENSRGRVFFHRMVTCRVCSIIRNSQPMCINVSALKEIKIQHYKLVLPSQPPCHHEQKRSRPAIWRISNRICKSPSPPWQIGKSWSKSPAPFPDGVHAWGAILSSRLRVHSQSGRILSMCSNADLMHTSHAKRGIRVRKASLYCPSLRHETKSSQRECLSSIRFSSGGSLIASFSTAYPVVGLPSVPSSKAPISLNGHRSGVADELALRRLLDRYSSIVQI